MIIFITSYQDHLRATFITNGYNLIDQMKLNYTNVITCSRMQNVIGNLKHG